MPTLFWGWEGHAALFFWLFFFFGISLERYFGAQLFCSNLLERGSRVSFLFFGSLENRHIFTGACVFI